mmetsp:Transcript_4661/g.9833  ORF Transcript_4661/g.9833 Transcript_4661/m.9833 type:complete len:150 (+) Transcript_4661:120-569(+)|eukprot:CAMPEP_0194324142 /NCGR_PEP_ID=MMETSP0171-20130528/26676_1 /TAXON_ID=218684 /ORGANISM="Corethron pennatum, Strain L29A3" /LENGTH=149 /DNA_ID=CAMNT_0039082967 /DNA_START=103 /DNA_END=552 /DNA_ORIENTATION=+
MNFSKIFFFTLVGAPAALCQIEKKLVYSNQCGVKGLVCDIAGKNPCCNSDNTCGNTDYDCSIMEGCKTDYGICEVHIPKLISKGRCGAKYGGDKCDPSGSLPCCSQFDWCGSHVAWCGWACQPEFGLCDSAYVGQEPTLRTASNMTTLE